MSTTINPKHNKQTIQGIIYVFNVKSFMSVVQVDVCCDETAATQSECLRKLCLLLNMPNISGENWA